MKRPGESELRRGETATWGQKPQPRIRKFTPFRNAAKTILGFITIELSSGLIINDAKLMIGPQGRRWIDLPAVKQVDQDGRPRLDVHGKQIWSQIIEFRDSHTRERFQETILAALRVAHPELFDGEGGQ